MENWWIGDFVFWCHEQVKYLLGISANVKNCFGLFGTHSFTNCTFLLPTTRVICCWVIKSAKFHIISPIRPSCSLRNWSNAWECWSIKSHWNLIWLSELCWSSFHFPFSEVTITITFSFYSKIYSSHLASEAARILKL